MREAHNLDSMTPYVGPLHMHVELEMEECGDGTFLYHVTDGNTVAVRGIVVHNLLHGRWSFVGDYLEEFVNRCLEVGLAVHIVCWRRS